MSRYAEITSIANTIFMKLQTVTSFDKKIHPQKLRILKLVISPHDDSSGNFRNTQGQGHLRELLNPLVKNIINDKNLAINTNPIDIYKKWVNQTETETGKAR